ncbi:uncharacterized protein KGF55_001449 [Candida pseudojiufengensis]|uniref:uncharacterized protein n=1 Tax=Candida pseudojiufengensis TaxID=497109 RepID=UPI0022256172|nr:uncharacterized protein KGF55_001449 [Candida pseudojiufengensis]KAI5965229.1 hypothetical protein KGF55_001449 [Candida pseudojiufengensis]
MTDILNRGAKLFDDKNEPAYNHATDQQYKQLRSKADELYKKRNQLSQQSQQAYKQGDKQKAHELSEESKKATQEAESYSEKAAEYVFRENNTDSASDEIDLHGLYVKEAEWIVKKRINSCIQTNQSHLKVIVGKGLHSSNGISKLKPAIDQLCEESNLKHYIDPKNNGVLIIDFQNSENSQVPSHWNNPGISQPQQAYHGNNQPQYQQHQNYNQNNHYQQQQHHNNNNNQNIKTGNQFLDLLIKGVCMCMNSK